MNIIDAKKDDNDDPVMQHAKMLGQLITNLHSLELFIRVFLHHKNPAPPFELPICSDNTKDIHAGSNIPVNHLTNYDSLGSLIDQYNIEMNEHERDKLDRSIVTLRDAIAHGRVFTYSPDVPPSLVKFSKPNKNTVRVEFCEVMTPDWLHAQNVKVVSAINTIGPKIGWKRLDQT